MMTPDAGRTLDEAAIHTFLTLGWGDLGAEYRSIVFSLRPASGGTKTDFCDGTTELLNAVLAVAPSRDTYIQPAFVALETAERLAPQNRRGEFADLAGIVAFVADVDIAGPAHKKSNLPPTLDAALGLLHTLPLPPTVVVHSGNGIQAWWVFSEPFIFDSDDERTQTQAIANGWSDRLKGEAKRKGWTVDSVFDLTRVMRVPGTLNHKQQPPKPVTVLEAGGPLYGGPSDFRDFIATPALRVVDETYAPPVEVNGLRFDANAAIGIDLIDAICEYDEAFRITWRHKRKPASFPSGDDSPSSYHLALASTLVGYEWDDQQIVDAIIMWNRINKISLDKVMTRPDYWQRTLTKARKRLDAAATLAQINHEGVDAVAADNKLEMLRDRLGIDVAQIVQFGRQQARYTMLLSDGTEIPFGSVTAFSNMRTFRNAVMEATRKVVAVGQKDWLPLLQTMVSLAVVIDNPEGNRRESAREWLTGYFDTYRIVTHDIEGAFIQGSPFLQDDYIYFVLDNLFKYVEHVKGERIEKQDLRAALAAIGCRGDQKYMMVDNQQKNRRLWNVPQGVYQSWSAVDEED